MPQARTLTCISRPGSQLSQGASPRNISSDNLVRNRISPIQMNSGSAASVHEALLPQTVVASTAPGGMLPPTNSMPAYPQAISAIAIHTPAPNSRINRISAMVMRSISHRALDRLLDHFFGGLGLGLFVARRIAAHDMDELVDERDQQDDEACRIAKLRDPQRDRDHALRHFVEAPG